MREIDTAAVAPRGQQQHDAGQAASVRASGAGHAPKFPLQFPQPKESGPGASAEAEVQPNRRVSVLEDDSRHATHAARLLRALEAKQFATLQAAAALRAIAVTPTTTDRDLPAYVVSMGAYCRTVESLADLQALLARMGVRA